MTDDPTPPEQIAAAKALLAGAGFVVLREKSYANAEERRRTADRRRDWADEQAESTRKWAQGAFDEQRRLATRLGHLYGLAQALGATDEQLRGTAE